MTPQEHFRIARNGGLTLFLTLAFIAVSWCQDNSTIPQDSRAAEEYFAKARAAERHAQFLEIQKIKLRDVNILGEKKEFDNEISIKVRSTGKLLKSKIFFSNKTEANVEILDRETGISPGQACVFYMKDEFGDKLLGGGWIRKTFNRNLST